MSGCSSCSSCSKGCDGHKDKENKGSSTGCCGGSVDESGKLRNQIIKAYIAWKNLNPAYLSILSGLTSFCPSKEEGEFKSYVVNLFNDNGLKPNAFVLNFQELEKTYKFNYDMVFDSLDSSLNKYFHKYFKGE